MAENRISLGFASLLRSFARENDFRSLSDFTSLRRTFFAEGKKQVLRKIQNPTLRRGFSLGYILAKWRREQDIARLCLLLRSLFRLPEKMTFGRFLGYFTSLRSNLLPKAKAGSFWLPKAKKNPTLRRGFSLGYILAKWRREQDIARLCLASPFACQRK